ncbi:MAG: GNAT family N-acetyltransferase, partial [Caldilineales bacterium]|nr:GNAT family N-acetyltransferase [Caldilineales bacterium]
MMRIVEYDAVDPLQVLHLNLLCLDFALTPELVAIIRRMDPRPFPFFALYAVEGSTVAGQVGVFRLPVVSTAGAAEVGGVWAVSTHPAWRGRGVASLLLDEAHARMAAAGLRFSTLGANRYQVAHALYKKQGYSDLATLTRYVLGPRALLPAQPGLWAEPVGPDRLALADRL